MVTPMPSHHPDDERLFDYVSGASPEPVALLIATHLALCPRCRHEAHELEKIGGALLDDIPTEPMPEGSLDRMLARIELPDKPPKPAATLISDIGDRSIPQPLRSYLDAAIDDLPWRRRGSISEFPLMPDASEYSTRLLLIRAGAAAPRHTHEGIELTLVLKGTFSDAHGRYQPGDIEEADSGIDHRPVAGEDEDCLCLAVTDAPLKLTSRFGRLINPFINV